MMRPARSIPSLPAVIAMMLGGVACAADLPRTAAHDYEPPAPGTYALPVIKEAADGEVLDAEGRAQSLRGLARGRVTVLSFIYTRCADPKACPYATGVLRDLHAISRDDPAVASGLRLISISFDPENDTPAQMAAYAAAARSEKSGADWHFLTTASPTKLQPILDGYAQSVKRKENPNDPTGPLNHNLRVILIDPAGHVRNIYSSGTLDVRLVLGDIRTLLMDFAGRR